MQLFSRSNLLAGDRQAFATAARTRIGLGALSPRRQAATVTLSAIAVDFDQTFDIQTFDPAKVAFDRQSAFLDLFSNATDFVFSQILHPTIVGNLELLANLRGGRLTDSVDVRQRNVSTLRSGQIHSSYTGHLPSNSFKNNQAAKSHLESHAVLPGLSLALLVLGVFANDGDPPFAADDLALVADFLYGCSDFHFSCLLRE
jgi:hypothetical protein